MLGIGATDKAYGYKTQVGKIAKLPPQANVWWWHPNRVGVKTAPDSFKEQLSLMDENLAVTWNAYRESVAGLDEAPTPPIARLPRMGPVIYQRGQRSPLSAARPAGVCEVI
jgi:hypothetical protein